MEAISGHILGGHSAGPSRSEIEWADYVQELERQKQEPEQYAAHFSDGSYDPAALPILGRFERRNLEAQTVTQENVLLPRDELPAAKPRMQAASAPKSEIVESMAHMLDPPRGYDAAGDYDSHYDPVTHTYRAPLHAYAPMSVRKEREVRETAGGNPVSGRRLVQGYGPTAGPSDTLNQTWGIEHRLEQRQAPEWNPIMQKFYDVEKESASWQQVSMSQVQQHQDAIEGRLRRQPYDPVKWMPYDVVHGLSPPGQSPHEEHNKPSPPKKKSMQDSSHIRNVLHFSPIKPQQRPPTNWAADDGGVPVAQRDHGQRLIVQADLESQIQASRAQRGERIAQKTPIKRSEVFTLLDAEVASKVPQRPQRPDRRKIDGPADADGGVSGLINGVKRTRHIPHHRTFKISQMTPHDPLFNLSEPEPEGYGYY
jgi:hypothetical protein